MAKSPAQLDAEIINVLRTPAQEAALRLAYQQGHVYAGWNPGAGARTRVSAKALQALERAGLLNLARTANDLVGTLTRAGVAYVENAAKRSDKATKKSIPDAARTAIEHGALEYINMAYRRYADIGGKEPCLTVGYITDYLRQAHMPEDFRYALKEQQRTWTRSVLESMRRKGQIGSSFGDRSRCYEPKR
jgi:hypothetical protein